VAPKPELVRIAAVPASTGRWLAELDRAGALPGRGAYLCREAGVAAPQENCLRQAMRTGGLQRTLRRAVEIPTKPTGVGSLESDCEGGAAGRQSGWPHRGCEPKASVFPASAGPSSLIVL
jgi:predicted RNA-binding protein YlxR (DUF448 family)